MLVDNILKNREQNNNPIKVGIVGTGAMGFGLINQITRYTPGMTVAGVYNRTPAKAIQAFDYSGISDYVVCNGKAKTAQDAFDSGKPFITRDIDILLDLKGIDVLVEITGTIEFALMTVLKAFKKGISVLSFNAELESAFGPLLKQTACDYGVRYGLSDGDQPGVTMNLYRHVKCMGFEPLLCGNIKSFHDRYRNPETQKGFAAKWGMSPEMVTSFADGTKISFEQSCIANATGMKVAKRGMLGYHSNEHVDELTHLYDVDRVRELGGIVDYVIGAKPSPGVFIYAAINDPYSKKILSYAKMGNGQLYSFYAPYHLLFFEITSSVCRLVDLDDPVIISKKEPVVDVITAAKVNLYKGDIIDGIGGFKTYGLCENHDIVLGENILPMALAKGSVLKRNVKRDEILSFDDVEIDESGFLFSMNKLLDNMFPVLDS